MPNALETAKALEMIGRKGPKVAMCPRDRDEPLVCTFDRRGYEFTCLKCGGWYGWLDPLPADETPELLALCEQRKQEYASRAK